MSAQACRAVVERTYAIPLDAAWDMLANTDRVNRTVGLPSVSYGAATVDAERFFRPASATMMGLRVRWKEYPFSWVRDQQYAVVREPEGSPLRRMRITADLAAVPGGTRVRIGGEAEPRNLLGRLLAPLFARQTARNIAGYCDQYVARLGAAQPNPLPPATARSPVAAAQLERRLGRLAGLPLDQALVERLRRRLVEGADDEVLRMRPFVIADEWGAERYEVLRLFLHATKAGLLDLSWDLICPNCRVAQIEYGSMADLRGTFHCDLCGVDYQAELDRYVELRFAVNPAVRRAEDAIYCIGGPVNTPHILAQQYLRPGEAHALSVNVRGEGVRARVLRRNAVVRLDRLDQLDHQMEGAATGEITLTYREDDWEPARGGFIGDDLRVCLRNATAQPIVAVIEKVRWDERAVTAAQVTALQEFRDLFASEVLAPGQQIGIRSIALMFTDLKGSTAMYEGLGDALAYGQVRKHFGFLIEAVNRHHGALVKTIGDAVMAVFATPTDAVRAALEVQTSVAAFNADAAIEPPLIIKLGVHHGAAIAINANERLDYFGRTVNVAARVQHESVGGDVVMSAALFHEPEIQSVLADYRYEATPFAAQLRGIAGEIALLRLVPTGRRTTSDPHPATLVTPDARA